MKISIKSGIVLTVLFSIIAFVGTLPYDLKPMLVIFLTVPAVIFGIGLLGSEDKRSQAAAKGVLLITFMPVLLGASEFQFFYWNEVPVIVGFLGCIGSFRLPFQFSESYWIEFMFCQAIAGWIIGWNLSVVGESGALDRFVHRYRWYLWGGLYLAGLLVFGGYLLLVGMPYQGGTSVSWQGFELIVHVLFYGAYLLGNCVVTVVVLAIPFLRGGFVKSVAIGHIVWGFFSKQILMWPAVFVFYGVLGDWMPQSLEVQVLLLLEAQESVLTWDSAVVYFLTLAIGAFIFTSLSGGICYGHGYFIKRMNAGPKQSEEDIETPHPLDE
ncbi:MAG: hypothetical protein MPJ24_03375 [Pirellulaceae bacterium]|nr:hypothetical protein [Pirellulaceae bacterium]